jgi:hypothetical protein
VTPPKPKSSPHRTAGTGSKQTATKPAAKAKSKGSSKGATGANNVALSPQAIAAQASALAATEASVQALGFYRIPLFLLPIYKAAAIQYGVPWQILAAINEIETNYGTDLSVSSAGAVGWMQFMPTTWLQYGVDALNAGYADPYNPVDAIFAAARYLRAAGAATNLPGAILAYNHSAEYVSSVLLRAKLISAYPRAVIATLTGLVDGRLPVTGAQVAWGPLPSSLPPASSTATAGAVPTGTGAAGAGHGGTALAPTVAAGRATSAGAHPLQLVELTSAPDSKAVAVQNGRIVQIGRSRALGRYVILRDVYGDVFTYAGLGSVAPTYKPAKRTAPASASPLVRAASQQDTAPAQAATAGFQAPLTLQVAPKRRSAAAAALAGGQASTSESETGLPGRSKVRLFAHPGNPDARAAAAARAAARRGGAGSLTLPLRAGSVVPTGTVLGTVNVPAGSHSGHIRFAIRPAGDNTTIDPGPVLANWAQLQAALHPKGARAEDALLGATASDVFLLSKAELQRAVLSDPEIAIYTCGRQDIASGAVDKRVLAVLAFLSRSGLAPTVTGLRCGQVPVTTSGAASAAYRGDAVEISAINGTPIAGHQGPGTVTDVAIRTLLTLPSEFLPESILSLMRYPGASSTHQSREHWNRLGLQFSTAPSVVTPASAARAAHHGAHAARAVPLLQMGSLSASQWEQLIGRIAALPAPKVAHRASTSAIPDPKRRG